MQKYDAPAENVITPSLEALQAYSLGYQAMERNDYAAAIPLARAVPSDKVVPSTVNLTATRIRDPASNVSPSAMGRVFQTGRVSRTR